MIPLRDNIPSVRTPVVNYAVLAICGVVFLVQITAGGDGQQIVERYGMIPARLTHPDKTIVVPHTDIIRKGPFYSRQTVDRPVSNPPFSVYLTLITCMFLHGGWMHLLGNMLFLYIFGDNVEDRLGHIGYLGFYLFSGVLAGLAHLFTEPGSVAPTIGASGAIAGVMGAYFLLYPNARVLTIVPVFFFLEFVVLPAWVMLGFWFVIQLFQGSLAAATPGAGGVAWWAHIGGFVVGAGLVYALRGVGFLQQRVPKAYPVASRFAIYHDRRPW